MSMRRVSLMGCSVATTGAAVSAPASTGGFLWRSQAPVPANPARARNGSAGSPGSSASTAAAPAAIASGFGLRPSWRISAASAVPSMPPLVTTMPAAVETSSAGICETSPSPAVSVVNVAAASANDMPCRIRPIVSPPTMLIIVMISAANELRRAVHRAIEAALFLEFLPAATRFLLVDQACGKVCVDRHLLARHRIETEPCGDLGDAAGALGDDHEVHHQQDRDRPIG